jgi:hypothetical protein
LGNYTEERWRGKALKLSNHAYRELFSHHMTLYDVLEVLERGYDCSRSRRKKGVIERCLRTKSGLTRVVVAESYNHDEEMEIWLVIHVGVTR